MTRCCSTGIEAYYGDSHVLHEVSFALGEARLLGLLAATARARPHP